MILHSFVTDERAVTEVNNLCLETEAELSTNIKLSDPENMVETHQARFCKLVSALNMLSTESRVFVSSQKKTFRFQPECEKHTELY